MRDINRAVHQAQASDIVSSKADEFACQSRDDNQEWRTYAANSVGKSREIHAGQWCGEWFRVQQDRLCFVATISH